MRSMIPFSHSRGVRVLPRKVDRICYNPLCYTNWTMCLVTQSPIRGLDLLCRAPPSNIIRPYNYAFICALCLKVVSAARRV